MTGKIKFPDKDVKHAQCAQKFEGRYNLTNTQHQRPRKRVGGKNRKYT